jgi:RNA polymerase sigma-70 factor (ECF subfamily)
MSTVFAIQRVTTRIEPPTTIGVAGSWELVRAAQAGDRDAFAALYERYQPVVARFVAVRVRNWAEVEDLTSDTFVRALRGLGSVSYQGRDVGAWLVTIARNLVLDRAKSFRVRRTDQSGLVPDEPCDPDAGPEELAFASIERAAAKARLAELVAAATQLAAVEQRCLQLRFGEQLPLAETAARLGRGVRATKAIQTRALAKLRVAAGVRPATELTSVPLPRVGQEAAA